MAIKLVLAFIAAFAVTLLIGKYLVPWLKEHGSVQPLKDEVEQKIYSGKNDDRSTGKRSDRP